MILDLIDFFAWNPSMDGLVIRMGVWLGGTLAMEMVCCSMASWMATRSSSLIWATKKSLAVVLQRGKRLDGQKKEKDPTLSNSSMQTTPPSASTMAPPSMMKPRVLGSRSTEAVRPAALLPLPEVYTWRPTTTCQSKTDSDRTGVSREVMTCNN